MIYTDTQTMLQSKRSQLRRSIPQKMMTFLRVHQRLGNAEAAIMQQLMMEMASLEVCVRSLI